MYVTCLLHAKAMYDRGPSHNSSPLEKLLISLVLSSKLENSLIWLRVELSHRTSLWFWDLILSGVGWEEVCTNFMRETIYEFCKRMSTFGRAFTKVLTSTSLFLGIHCGFLERHDFSWWVNECHTHAFMIEWICTINGRKSVFSSGKHDIDFSHVVSFWGKHIRVLKVNSWKLSEKMKTSVVFNSR